MRAVRRNLFSSAIDQSGRGNGVRIGVKRCVDHDNVGSQVLVIVGAMSTETIAAETFCA